MTMELIDFQKLKTQAEATMNVAKQAAQNATEWASEAASSASSKITDIANNAGKDAKKKDNERYADYIKRATTTDRRPIIARRKLLMPLPMISRLSTSSAK